MGVQIEEKELKHMGIKTGDVLIERKPHSCVVKFVEAADSFGILLVDGKRDEFYLTSELDKLEAKYELMTRYEDRKDSFK